MFARPRSFRRQPPAHIALAVAAWLLLCGLLAWHVHANGPFRIDDAYITFSFSKNLATVLGGFRSGRLIDRREGKALFFLERRDELAPPARELPAWAVIDYPFGL